MNFSSPSTIGRNTLRRVFLGAASCGLAAWLAGCAAVKPWEREKLASPCMQNPFGKNSLAGAYDDKLTQTKTAGGLPGDAPGGGCGCVQ